MKRRHLLALAGAMPLAAQAEAPKRVGFLIQGDAEPTWSLYRKAMADLVAEEGGLSYATDYADLTRVLARQTDKLLKGVPAGDIPVQQSTRFEMVVNRKTASALGLALSPTFLARADEAIE